MHKERGQEQTAPTRMEGGFPKRMDSMHLNIFIIVTIKAWFLY